MTPMSKKLLGLLLFAVLCPWYSCKLASQLDNLETSGEEPLHDPVLDPSGCHCQRNKNPKGLGFIGVKYNLLRGSPEGKTKMGGVDPGLEITREDFKANIRRRPSSPRPDLLRTTPGVFCVEISQDLWWNQTLPRKTECRCQAKGKREIPVYWWSFVQFASLPICRLFCWPYLLTLIRKPEVTKMNSKIYFFLVQGSGFWHRLAPVCKIICVSATITPSIRIIYHLFTTTLREADRDSSRLAKLTAVELHHGRILFLWDIILIVTRGKRKICKTDSGPI